MTLHLVGFPHHRPDGSFPSCAYVEKTRKLRLAPLEDQLILYGAEGADVALLDEDDRLSLFGPDDASKPPEWPDTAQWNLFNTRAVEAIRERAQPDDLLLLAGGYSQKPVADALPHLTACEPGVGYKGTCTGLRAFESHAWRHHIYGRQNTQDGCWMDAVIPNYFDPADFPFVNDGTGDYLLFLGRVVLRKGPHVAARIAQELGMKLVVAGPRPDPTSADHVELEGDVDYVGPVGSSERAKLLAGAAALLAPTLYIEPFGGVAVEAMLAGTPAVTSNFGAFTETVPDEYRFHTLQEGIDCVRRAFDTDHEQLRADVIARYSLDAVAPLYDRWFRRLRSLRGDGWYALDDSLDERKEPADARR